MSERILPNFDPSYPIETAKEIGYSTEWGKAAYGAADPTTSEIVNAYLDRGAQILGRGALELLDVGGGDGEKHALPTAAREHYATILDNDPNPLWYARQKIRPYPQFGAYLRTVMGDAHEMDDLLRTDLGQFDISVNVGYIYLLPEEKVRKIFRNTSELLNPEWHASVVQFNTNIVRKNDDGEDRRGQKERRYTQAEGKELVASLFEENGFKTPQYKESKLDHVGPGLTVTADVLIAAAEGGERAKDA